MSKHSSTNIVYSANVTIQHILDNKVIKTLRGHNEGETALFLFLLNCLNGSFESNRVPMYLRMFNHDSSTDVDTEITEYEIIKTDSYINISEVSLNIEFTVPSHSLNPEANSFNRVKIYNREDTSNPLAVMDLESPSTITSGENLLIIWSMKVSNSNTQGE